MIDSDAAVLPEGSVVPEHGRGTATIAYRPIPFEGTFTLDRAVASRMNFGDPGSAIGDDDRAARVDPAAVPGPTNRTADPLRDAATFSRTSCPRSRCSTSARRTWARLPQFSQGTRYALADPERYVDPATGQLLVRFVNDRSDAGRLPVPGRDQRERSNDRASCETRGLVKRYDRTLAVAGVDLDIDEGEIFGLVGPNGAGKTTTLRMLATLLQPTSGDAEIAGYSVARNPDAVRRVLGYMPDAFGVYDDMKVWEYLDFFGRCYGLPAGRRGAG